MPEANKELVRRYYAAALGDATALDALISPSFIDHHMPPGLPAGPAGVRQFFQDILASIFSDMRIEHSFMLAEGDRVDCHFALIARHTGDYGEIKAKGNAIRCPAISTFRIENGRLAEAWEIYDSGALLAQMRA